MSKRYLSFLLSILSFLLLATTTGASPIFVFRGSLNDPANLRSRFFGCINQFQRAGGLAAKILSQLDGAEVVISYQPGGGETVNPGGDTTGQIVELLWDSNLTGQYDDDASKLPCGVLLHELQHAARLFTGKECTGPFTDDNRAAYRHDESLGVRAENWWIYYLRQQGRPGLRQRMEYGPGQPLERWTRWPKRPDSPVPPAPPCYRAPAACTGFHQTGCVDFRGGIYSGGDHRRVAFGSLRIEVADSGHCQGREPCEFRDCYICPHLDTAFPEGATVTAIATPGQDSLFARWGPGACQGQGPTCTFTAQQPSCISAQFLLTNPTAPPQTLPDVPCSEDP